MLSKFNGTSTPKGSYRAKTGDNDCNVKSSHYSLSTALCESIRYQAKSKQNVRQDLTPRVRHGEAALAPPPPPFYAGMGIGMACSNAKSRPYEQFYFLFTLICVKQKKLHYPILL